MEKSSEEKQRLNAWIAPTLLKRFKAEAALRGMTLSEFVQEAIGEKLKKK